MDPGRARRHPLGGSKQRESAGAPADDPLYLGIRSKSLQPTWNGAGTVGTTAALPVELGSKRVPARTRVDSPVSGWQPTACGRARAVRVYPCGRPERRAKTPYLGRPIESAPRA